VNSSTITLERPWATPAGDVSGVTTYKHWSSNVAGKGQQPYMVAIKMAGFAWAAHLDSTLGTDFRGLRDAAATWAANTGYDTHTKGMHYARVVQSCEPDVAPVAGSIFSKPGCSYGADAAAQVAARMLNGEASPAFQWNQTDTLTRGDAAYAALWCSTSYNDAALYATIPGCDAVSPGDNLGLSNLLDGNLAGGKWPGFFFGMGMAHQWPAARLFGSREGTARLSGQSTVTGQIQ
jgi:hypothetical protein